MPAPTIRGCCPMRRIWRPAAVSIPPAAKPRPFAKPKSPANPDAPPRRRKSKSPRAIPLRIEPTPRRLRASALPPPTSAAPKVNPDGDIQSSPRSAKAIRRRRFGRTQADARKTRIPRTAGLVRLTAPRPPRPRQRLRRQHPRSARKMRRGRWTPWCMELESEPPDPPADGAPGGGADTPGYIVSLSMTGQTGLPPGSQVAENAARSDLTLRNSWLSTPAALQLCTASRAASAKLALKQQPSKPLLTGKTDLRKFALCRSRRQLSSCAAAGFGAKTAKAKTSRTATGGRIRLLFFTVSLLWFAGFLSGRILPDLEFSLKKLPHPPNFAL